MRACGARISRGIGSNGRIEHRYRLRSDLRWAGADAVGRLPGRRLGQVRGQNVDAFPVIADLHRPKIFDLPGMFARTQHAPTIDAQLAVGKGNRGQFHAHAVKLRNKSLNVKVRHSTFSFNPQLHADFGEMEPIMRSPIPRCHSRESGNPVLRSTGVVTKSPAVADPDPGCAISAIVERTLIRPSRAIPLSRVSTYPDNDIALPFLTHGLLRHDVIRRLREGARRAQ